MDGALQMGAETDLEMIILNINSWIVEKEIGNIYYVGYGDGVGSGHGHGIGGCDDDNETCPPYGSSSGRGLGDGDDGTGFCDDVIGLR
jgi:hypothetical protein